jgi:hypothetical protein
MTFFVVLLFIVAGTVLLRWVDPKKGRVVVAEEY